MIRVYSKSDVGLVRTENQDRVNVLALPGGNFAVILCDGMGGQNAGSLAAELTVNTMTERIERGYRPDISENGIRNLLITSVVVANNAVHNKSHESPEYDKMGTTCAAMIITPDRAYTINVGDSRVYLIDGDFMRQITRDHTYVRSLIDEGKITVEESMSHPKLNMLLRAVGAEPEVTPDYFESELNADSLLLICTDGLHHYGEESEIADICVNGTLRTVPDRLIAYANSRGGRDNTTVAVIGL